MTTFRQKLHPHVLIPWVVALVALFGCNVFAQQKPQLRKSAHLDGGSLTQLTTEVAPSGATNHSLLGLANGSYDGISLREPAAQRLAISSERGKVDNSRREGAVQGRAPPTSALR